MNSNTIQIANSNVSFSKNADGSFTAWEEVAQPYSIITGTEEEVLGNFVDDARSEGKEDELYAAFNAAK